MDDRGDSALGEVADPDRDLPAFTDLTVDDATLPYADPMVFLFLGGFLIAIAMQ